jgi:hypothetical protein
MEPSEIRKRVLHALEHARRGAVQHREDADQASQAFAKLLPNAAATWKIALNVLKAEGHAFSIQTPTGMLRAVAERSGDDYIEVALDTSRRPPAVVVRTRMSRGRHVIDRESVVAEGDNVIALTDERLLAVLLAEIEPFVER